MSALPFLTALPPAPSQSSSAGALSSTKPASELTSQTAATHDDSDMSTMHGEMGGLNNQNNDEGTTSFWDTLKQQTASIDPSLGQQISALNTKTEVTSDPMNELDDAIEISDASILLTTQASAQTAPAPWSMASIQQSMQQSAIAGEVNGNPAMEQIESQRIAQPQLQAGNAGALSPNALQAQGQATASLASGVASPILEGEMNKTAQPALSQFALANGKAGVNTGATLDETKLNTGFKLDDSLLSKEPINIHEKPITLTPQETLTTPISTQAAPLTEAALSNVADSLEGIQGLSQQSTKELQASPSRFEGSAVANADKVLSGQAKFDVPPSSPKFTEQVAQRIGIMNTENLQTARIQLDPPELGSLEIKIKVQQDQVSVAFSSGHAVVRDALEAQSPRLREMLEQQGVELKDVNVSDQQQQTAGEGNSNGSNGDASGDWADDDQLEEAVVTTVQSDSLVDDFA